MDLTTVRRQIVVAIAADDYLMELLVLKGGNALELIHKIGERASIDLDFSMEQDLENTDEFGTRLFAALSNRLDAIGLVLFDGDFKSRPSTSGPGVRWGGYTATFKLIEKEKWFEHEGDIRKLRNYATISGPSQLKTFKLEVSKFEYCVGKERNEIDGFACYVYTTAMIAAEKLRAICQQMEQYGARTYPTARARDFYDVTMIIQKTGLDVTSDEFVELVREMFSAKEVNVELLSDIGEEREYHRVDWDAVVLAARGDIREFDYYFDFVLEYVGRLLEALGKE